MDIVYRLGRATAADVHERLADAPTYTTVRGLLRVLEQKGHLRHEEEEQRYVYVPSTSRAEAGASHIAHVVRTFFDGSPAKAMAAMLGGSAAAQLSSADLKRVEAIVEAAARRAAAAAAAAAAEDEK
jgi:predicted transcriptional regulator